MCLIAATAYLIFGPPPNVASQAFGQLLSIVATIILGQGYLHQVLMLKNSGDTGGVSLRFHQLTLTKDISTIAMGLAMGAKTGWPIFLMNGVSAITKIVVMYFYRRVRLKNCAIGTGITGVP